MGVLYRGGNAVGGSLTIFPAEGLFKCEYDNNVLKFYYSFSGSKIRFGTDTLRYYITDLDCVKLNFNLSFNLIHRFDAFMTYKF